MGKRKRIGLAVGALLGAGGLAFAYRKAAKARPEEIGYPPLDTPNPVADDLWVVDGEPINAMGLKLPVRMTIIRLENGDLLLHSPTRLTPELAREIERLGRVRHLVAPNIAHWTFLKDWQGMYPHAVTWAAPGLRDRLQVRLSGVRLDHDLNERAPEEWASEIEQALVQGGLGYREIGFFHRPSRTLILTDLVQNLELDKLPPATRWFARAMGGADGRPPAYLRAAVKRNRDEAAAAACRMIALDPERVIFAHGRWFDGQGAQRLRQALDWLL